MRHCIQNEEQLLQALQIEVWFLFSFSANAIFNSKVLRAHILAVGGSANSSYVDGDPQSADVITRKPTINEKFLIMDQKPEDTAVEFLEVRKKRRLSGG